MILHNSQSYLCGLVSGLLFAPTTVGAMTWGVAFFQVDRHVPFDEAVMLAAAVPLGWAVGCPLMGWIADRSGLRKPTLIGGAIVMLIGTLQLTFAPSWLPALLSVFAIGVASGAAMIPYTIVTEVNPRDVKGSATGVINFITFGLTAVIGLIFASLFGRTLSAGNGVVSHFEHAGAFWAACIALAIVVSCFLRETGRARVDPIAKLRPLTT